MLLHGLFILVCLIWGTSFIFMKYAGAAFGPLGIGGFRLLLGAATLGALWVAGVRRWPLTRRDVPAVALLAAVGYAVPFYIQPYVIMQVEHHAGHGSAFGGRMVALVPRRTVVVSVPLLRAVPTVRQCVGVGGGLVCIAMLFREELNLGVPLPTLLLGAVTPLCYACANTYVKRRFHHAPPMAVALVALLAGGLMLTPLSLRYEAVEVDLHFARAAASMLALGVLCTGVAGYLFYTIIRSQGPLFAGMVAYIIPCVALGVAHLAGEQLAAGQLAAMAGIFVMVALVQVRPGVPASPTTAEG